MKKHSIVIIEDNMEDLEVVVSSLTKKEYTLNIFGEGIEAWEYLQNNAETVDVVILAKTIPNISGMEILSSMQKHPVLKNKPVIVQTVDAGEGKYKNAIECGANFYVLKPLEEKKIVSLVKASLRASNITVGDQPQPPRKSFVETIRRKSA